MYNATYWSSPGLAQYFKNKNYNELMYEWHLRYYGQHGGSIIDVGCGYGRNLIPFANNENYDVFCFDPCADAVMYTAQRFGLSRHKYMIAPIQKMPWNNKKFDFVICDGVLHQQLSAEQFLDSLKYCKNLLSEGNIFISVFTEDIIPEDCLQKHDHIWINNSGIKMILYKSEEILYALDRLGMEVIALKKEIFQLDVGKRSNLSVYLKKR